MPLSYGDVLTQWDRSRAFGDPRDLPTFSSELNAHTGTNDYDEGLRDSWWRRASTRADQSFFNPIASVTTEPIGRAVGGLFGEKGAEVGAEVGRALPRTIAQTIPAFFGPPGWAASGALFGAQTYADTGSAKAAAISGATGALLPGITKLAKPFLPAVLGVAEEAAPFAYKALGFAGSQAAQVGTLEASQAAQAKTLGLKYDPLDPNFWATQIPYTAFDLIHTIAEPKTKVAKVVSKTGEAVTSGVGGEYVPPEATPEANARVDATLSRMEDVLSDPLATPEHKEAVTAAALGVSIDPSITPAAPRPDQTVTINGRGRIMENGNMKMLVNPEQSNVQGLQDHNNVFINDNPDLNMTSNPDGTLTVTTPAKHVSHNVTMPIRPEDFTTPDPNQPNLPVQPKEFAGFPADEKRTLEKNNIPTGELHTADITDQFGRVESLTNPKYNPLGLQAAIQNPDGSIVAGRTHGELVDGVKEGNVIGFVTKEGKFLTRDEAWQAQQVAKIQPLKSIAQQLDATDATIADAKAKIAAVPTTPEEVTRTIVPTPDAPALLNLPWIPQELKAVSSSVRYDTGGKYDAPTHAQAAELGTAAGETGAFESGYTTKSGEFIPKDAYNNRVIDAKLRDSLKTGATATQAVESTKLSVQTPVVDGATTDQNILREKGQTIATTPPKEPTVTSLRTPDDKPVHYDTASQLQEAIDAHGHANPLDTTQYEPSVINQGTPNEYWVARKRTGGKVSLEAEHGGTTVANLIDEKATVDGLTRHASEVTDPTYIPPQGRPDVSFVDATNALDRATKEPAVFARVLGMDASDPLQVLQATRFAKQAREIYRLTQEGEGLKLSTLNERLKAAGSQPLRSLQQAEDLLKFIGPGIDEFSGRYRNFTLDSTYERDPKTVEALKQGGVKAAVEQYIGDQKYGIMGRMAAVLHKVADYDTLNFTMDDRTGWHYNRDSKGIGNINVGSIRNPTALPHELAHHVFADLEQADTPTGVRLRATRNEVIDAIRKNAVMPQKVKEAITKAINGKWYDEYLNESDNAKAQDLLKSRWRSVAGEGNDDWIPVFYATMDPKELIPQMFSSPKVIEILNRTQMPGQKATVLNFFSKIWNRLFGGGQDTDTALMTLIRGIDSYMSGPKIYGKTIGKESLFRISGGKGRALQIPQVATAVQTLAQNSREVTDAFSGGGKLAEAAKDLGAARVRLNVKDPNFFQVFHDIKQDPTSFGQRVSAAVAKIDAQGRGNPVMRDGSDIKAFLNNLESSDPAVGLFMKQQFSPNGRSAVPGKVEIGPAGITNAGLSQLPERIANFASKIDTLSSEDGWKTLAKVQSGDGALIDPPYVGTQNHYAEEKRTITAEERIQDYKNHVLPAVGRGVNATIFDVADPKLMSFLKDNGFQVHEFQRTPTGKIVSKPEFVATNVPTQFTELHPTIGYTGGSYIRDSLVAAGVRPEALAERRSAIENLYRTGDLGESIFAFDSKSLRSATASQGDVNDTVRTALTTGVPNDVHSSVMNLLAADVPTHQDLYWQMKNDADIAAKLYKNIKGGLVPGALPEDAMKNLQFAQVKLNAMKRALGKQAAAMERFNQLNNFTSDGMYNTFGDALQGGKLPAPPDPTGMEDQAHELLGIAERRAETSRAELERTVPTKIRDFIIRNLMLTQYSKLHIPGFAPVADHTQQQQGKAGSRMSRLNFVRGMNPDTGDLDKKIIRTNKLVETNPNLSRAASDIRRWIQEQNKAKQEWSLGDPFVKDVLGRSGNPEAIKTELQSELRRRSDYVEQVTPQFLAELNRENTAYAIVSRETGMKPDAGRDLADQMFQALGAIQDPNNAVYGMEALRTMSTKMQPDTFLSALKLAKGLITDSQKHIDFMRDTPGYVTEQRFDDHHLVMVGPDGKPYRSSFKTTDAAKAKLAEKEAEGYKLLEYIPRSDANVVGGIREDVINSMKELDAQALSRLQEALKDKPDLLAQLTPMTQRASDYEASQAAFAPVPGKAAPRRRFIAGREDINMVTNNNLFYIKANNWMRHKLVRATSQLDMLDPDLLSNRASMQYAQKHVETQLSVDNQTARKLVEATYNWKLAWNFGVNLLHGVQSLTSGMSSLIAETGGVGDAFALTGKAQAAIIKRMATGKWDTATHNWLSNKLVADGHAGIASWSDIYGDQLVNMHDQSRNNNPLVKAVGGIQSAARGWTGMFLKFNDLIGAFAGFELGKSRGMSDNDAYNFAVDVKNRAYYTGGKAQRAVGLWSIKSKPVPQLISSLQTYTYGWFSQLMSNYIRGFGQAPEGLTAAQRSGAKKAFLYQLGAQAVMAGAIGLPGVGQGLALAKQASGVDIKAWLRQHLGEMFGEDQENGGLMTQLALHGLVSSFTPLDPSGRHIPTFPFIGVSPYKGFDVANLASAPVSAAADIVKGLMAAAKGDVAGASTLLPHVLQGPFSLWQGDGDIRDKQGGLITKLSPMEKFITAMGMTPSRVTTAKDTAAAAKQASNAATQEKSSAIDNLATTFRKNGDGAGRTALFQWFKDHPDEDQAKMVRAIASRVTAQTVPSDWRRNVNVGADLSGLSSRIPSTELQRLQTTQDVSQRLGLFQRPNPHTAALAAEVDAMMNSDPYLSRAEALQDATGRRPSRSRYSVLTPAEFQ